jgi:DNA-binding response OmpR family regulator
MPSPPAIDVLVVEDNGTVSAIVARALQRQGLTTDVAATVVEAKRLLARGAYKVLVLDLMLEDGTGYEILTYLATEKLPPMYIIVTTSTDAAMLAGLDRSLVKAVLLKPFDVVDFVDMVCAAAGHRSSHA